MKLLPLLEKGYDKTHECKTPDAVYSSKIEGKSVSMTVKLPFELDLSKEESVDLEAKLHYAIEKVLASYFPS